MQNQKGFTLIELIVVIVILGILAATAMPKFVDLRRDAQLAGIQGVAGGLASAGVVNYAARTLHAGSGTTATSGVSSCATIAAAIMDGGVPAGYQVTGTVPNCSVDTNPAVSAVPATITPTN